MEYLQKLYMAILLKMKQERYFIIIATSEDKEMAEYKILNKRGDVVGYVVYAEDGAMAILLRA